jgi:hypothetical protein
MASPLAKVQGILQARPKADTAACETSKPAIAGA